MLVESENRDRCAGGLTCIPAWNDVTCPTARFPEPGYVLRRVHEADNFVARFERGHRGAGWADGAIDAFHVRFVRG